MVIAMSTIPDADDWIDVNQPDDPDCLWLRCGPGAFRRLREMILANIEMNPDISIDQIRQIEIERIPTDKRGGQPIRDWLGSFGCVLVFAAFISIWGIG